MSQSTHVSELLPAYALECLDPDEVALVSEHLASCSLCRTELESYEAVAENLALAATDAAPPRVLKRRLMARIGPAHSPDNVGPRPAWWERLTTLWRRAAPAWGVLSLVVILGLVVSNLMLRQQDREGQFTSGGMRVVVLNATAVAPGASGTLVISADGEYGSLVVDGLPPLDDAHQYQLWLVKDGQRTNGGVFSVNYAGYGVLWIDSSAPLSSFPDFGVTIEPVGGSPGPTGDKVLGGSL